MNVIKAMKKSLHFLCYISLVVSTYAQSNTGITGKPDTSYSTYGAYLSTVKTHPQAKWVDELHTAAVAEKKNIVYCELGDRKLSLDVFQPTQNSKKGRVAILIIHGGGWRTGNRTQHYPLAQRLANLGYVCITPEYRLSTEALFPAAVYDIKTSLRWVRSHAKEFDIDPEKIAVLGFSAGGELAAFMGTTNGIAEFEGKDCFLHSSSNVQAVIDIDGILAFIHPESGEGDDSKRTSAATNWFGYSKTENPELWKKGSPLTYAGKNTPPTLFINSGVDRMHAGRTDYIKILDQHKIYSDVKHFEGSPHSFCLFEPWFSPTVKYIDDFLVKLFGKP